MKNLPHFISILVLSAGLLFTSINLSSCTKSSTPITLPPATQNGSNTMGAYVDNTPFNAASVGFGTGIIAGYSGTAFQLLGYSNNSDRTQKTSINILLSNFTGVGNYTLNHQPGLAQSSGQVDISQGATETVFYTDSLQQGTIAVTYFDPVRQIVSGIFQLNAADRNNSSSVISVTDGRFDIVSPVNTLN